MAKLSVGQALLKAKSHGKKGEFEEAQKIKEKVSLLSNYQSKSTIINPSINNVDVFSIISDETHGYANFFKISRFLTYTSF